MNSATATIGATSARPRSAKEDSLRRRGVTVVVISSLMLLALVLRLKGLDATNIWLDEANSWRVARLPWGAMMENLRSSPLGPLYFVLLKLWMAVFGDSEAALRAPSLIASILVIPITYVIGERVFSRRAAVAGAVLLTLSPLQLYFAQEARMYMLLTLFAALYFLAYLLWRDATSAPAADAASASIADTSSVPAAGTASTSGAGVDPGRSSRALVWYSLAGTVMVYTNIISATLILAINIDAFWLLLRRYRRGVPGSARAAIEWTVANAVITGAFLIYLFTVHLGSAGSSQGWRGALGGTEAVRALFEYPLVAMHGVYYYAHDFASAATDLQRYPSIPAFDRFLELLVVQPLTLITIVLAIGAGAIRGLAGARRAVVLAVVVPLAIGTVVSISQQLDLGRYFLFTSPFLFLLIGHGLASTGTASGLVSLAVLLLTTGLGIRRYESVGARDSDYRPVASMLAHDTSGASVILVQPPEAGEPLSYYLRNERTPPLHGIPSDAPIARALLDSSDTSRFRAWLVLDYRSHLYDDSPDALRDSIGARVLSDRFLAGAGGGVRMLLLETRAGQAVIR